MYNSLTQSKLANIKILAKFSAFGSYASEYRKRLLYYHIGVQCVKYFARKKHGALFVLTNIPKGNFKMQKNLKSVLNHFIGKEKRVFSFSIKTLLIKKNPKGFLRLFSQLAKEEQKFQKQIAPKESSLCVCKKDIMNFIEKGKSLYDTGAQSPDRRHTIFIPISSHTLFKKTNAPEAEKLFEAA